MLIGEPYFFASILPWHMLFFWYARTHVDGWLSDNVKIVPQQGILRAMTGSTDFTPLIILFIHIESNFFLIFVHCLSAVHVSVFLSVHLSVCLWSVY